MMLVCSNRCGGQLFRALFAEVDVDASGEYQDYRVAQPGYVCLNCGAPAVDLGERARRDGRPRRARTKPPRSRSPTSSARSGETMSSSMRTWSARTAGLRSRWPNSRRLSRAALSFIARTAGASPWRTAPAGPHRTRGVEVVGQRGVELRHQLRPGAGRGPSCANRASSARNLRIRSMNLADRVSPFHSKVQSRP